MNRSLLLFLLFLPTLSFAGYFKISPAVEEAYQMTVELRLEKARLILTQIKREEPDNLMAYHIENYIDFFTIFIHENKEEFKRLSYNKDRRLDLIARGDRSSPYFLFTQAEIKLQWALSRLKFEEYFTALTEVRSAYKMLLKNQKKFPNFVANNKSLGIIHALVGTLPDNYQWGLKMLGGIEGSIAKGRREIESVLAYANENEFLFHEETQTLYAWLLLHLEKEDQAAWDILSSTSLAKGENPLSCFVMANVAMHTNRNDKAIQLLENRSQDSEYFHFPYLDYMLGASKLYRLDNTAHFHLKKYISTFNGQNYLKEAYQKLAWHYLIQGDQPSYRIWIAKAKTEGVAIIGGDKQALKEAESGMVPHPELLKARLLFDGAYFDKAYQVLSDITIGQLQEKRYQLEYYYRLGRVADDLQKKEEAIQYYRQTIDQGKNESYYYACNSALQLGILYERQNKNEKARQCFRECLSMTPNEYKNSLHQKAKAGLGRLKGKP